MLQDQMQVSSSASPTDNIRQHKCLLTLTPACLLGSFCCCLPVSCQNSNTCARCHSAPVCTAVHAVVERGCAASSGMEPDQWASLVGPGGVSAAAAEWGAKWLRLIDWEEAAGRARRAEMWALTGELLFGEMCEV